MNTPAQWYTYEVKNPQVAFESCLRILRLATSRTRIEIGDIRTKVELTAAERELIMARSIRRFLDPGYGGKCLREFMLDCYAPWTTAVLARIS